MRIHTVGKVTSVLGANPYWRTTQKCVGKTCAATNQAYFLCKEMASLAVYSVTIPDKVTLQTTTSVSLKQSNLELCTRPDTLSLLAKTNKARE